MLLFGAYRLNCVKLFRVPNMVLNGITVTFIPTTVFKHSRKGKLFDNLYIDNVQTRNYAMRYQ